MQTKSNKGKSPEEIKGALAENKKDGFSPTLAFVFITKIENAEVMRAILDKEGITIFGDSTSENFTEQGIQSDDIVVLLLDISKGYFRIVLKDYNATSHYESAR